MNSAQLFFPRPRHSLHAYTSFSRRRSHHFAVTAREGARGGIGITRTSCRSHSWLAGIIHEARKTFVPDQMAALGLDKQPRVLHDFSDAGSLDLWRVTTDQKFGGKSTGSIVAEDGVGVFAGTLSLETTGAMVKSGFAHARWTPEEPDQWDHFDTLAVRFKTDGRLYSVTISTDSMLPQQMVWQAPIPSAEAARNKWCVVHIPFRSFVLTYQGFVEQHQMDFNASKVKAVGITLADDTEGPFRLEVDWMKILQDDNQRS